jgi:hypothetical protein
MQADEVLKCIACLSTTGLYPRKARQEHVHRRVKSNNSTIISLFEKSRNKLGR